MPETIVDANFETPRHVVAWIGLCPEFAGLERLFQIANDEFIVVRLDEELLPLAHTFAQPVGLTPVLRREAGLPEVRVAQPEKGISLGEIHVEADGSLEQRHCGGEVTLSFQGLRP